MGVCCVNSRSQESSIGASGDIVVLTSFPPNLVRFNGGEPMEDYDRLCLQSWIACGFRVVAVNTSDEIHSLSGRYPQVEFIPAKRTARSLYGRDTPFIADMLSLLAERKESVLGIINCDLLFEPDRFWTELPEVIAGKTVVTGQRYDLRTLSGGVMNPYFPGFDYFFFDRTAAQTLAGARQPFSMGLPWWDYWFPLSLMLRGYGVQCFTRPAVLHLVHEQQVTGKTPTWRRLAREYARTALRDSTLRRLEHEDWQTLLDLCRAIDQADDARFEAGDFDQHIIDMSSNTVPLLAGKMTQVTKGPLALHPLAVPEGTFDNLAGRAAAGTALVRGLWGEKHDNLPRAEWQFEHAARMAPTDASALFECGNFFYRQGKMQRAAAILARAVECMPESPQLLNSLGSALGHLGRNDEAAACFERAVDADPLDGGSYYNLAVVLWLKNRHMEVVSRLEQRLAQTPDFPDGSMWLQRIRETLSRFGGEVSGVQGKR